MLKWVTSARQCSIHECSKRMTCFVPLTVCAGEFTWLVMMPVRTKIILKEKVLSIIASKNVGGPAQVYEQSNANQRRHTRRSLLMALEKALLIQSIWMFLGPRMFQIFKTVKLKMAASLECSKMLCAHRINQPTSLFARCLAWGLSSMHQWGIPPSNNRFNISEQVWTKCLKQSSCRAGFGWSQILMRTFKRITFPYSSTENWFSTSYHMLKRCRDSSLPSETLLRKTIVKSEWRTKK